MSGLLGVDFLKYLSPMKPSRFMIGAAFELDQRSVTFGHIEYFLPAQKSNDDPQICGMNYSQVIIHYSECPVTHRYSVLERKSKYLDPLDCFAGSSVERTVERFFNLEIAGIKEDSVSDYDRDKIDSFPSFMTFIDGCYFVDLPLNEDMLFEVLSKDQMALNVLDGVVAGDAQVVLSWLLTNDIKTKNVFVKNRLEDIHEGIAKMRGRGIHVKFK